MQDVIKILKDHLASQAVDARLMKARGMDTIAALSTARIESLAVWVLQLHGVLDERAARLLLGLPAEDFYEALLRFGAEKSQEVA